MNEDHCDDIDIRAKIRAYSTFIDKTLRPQLESAVAAREEVENDIKEYESLHSKLSEMKKNKTDADGPMDTLVDMGHAAIYCHVVVDDPSKIFVHTAMGFYVEMTIDEAVQFVAKRIKFLRDEVSEHRTHRATVIAVHMEETLLVLQELGKEAAGAQSMST